MRKIAIISLVSLLFISWQIPFKENQQVAMSRCSKPEAPRLQNENVDQKKKEKTAPVKLKGAAKKVVDGDNLTMTERKGAAKKAIEAEKN